jgi:ribonuclease HIII
MGVSINESYTTCAEKTKALLEEAGMRIVGERDTGSNVQYQVLLDDTPLGYLRFYDSNDGTTVDLSQLSSGHEHVKNAIDGYIDFPEPISNETLDAIAPYDVIGTDESGKGDYFGPLVVAAVYIPSEATVNELQHLGVTDSKNVSDAKVYDQAKKIHALCDVAVVQLPPSTYNRLYEDIGNLNELMGWAHARAIEDLLEDGTTPEAIISDKFGDESYINDMLMDYGKDANIVQETKAEQHIAVAAASIIARNTFLQKLSGLGMQYGIELPKGAGENVIEAGKTFVQQHGKEKLGEIAKLHFSTTKQVT